MRKETIEEHNKDLRRIRELTIVIDAKQAFTKELMLERRKIAKRVWVREEREKKV